MTEVLGLDHRDERATHEPRYSCIGPSLTFATIAAPSSIAKNVNTTKSRQLHDMRPSPFPHTTGIDVTSSGALLTNLHVLTMKRAATLTDAEATFLDQLVTAGAVLAQRCTGYEVNGAGGVQRAQIFSAALKPRWQ